MPPEMMAPMKTSAVGKRRSGTSVCTARYAATVSSWATSDEKKHFTHHVRRKRAGRGQSMCRRPPLRQPRVTTGSSSAPGKDVAISDTSKCCHSAGSCPIAIPASGVSDQGQVAAAEAVKMAGMLEGKGVQAHQGQRAEGPKGPEQPHWHPSCRRRP
eukprot:scaffold5972_cov25-Tisochrysis_lutea.AAC.3